MWLTSLGVEDGPVKARYINMPKTRHPVNHSSTTLKPRGINPDVTIETVISSSHMRFGLVAAIAITLRPDSPAAKMSNN
jgi:hypothetical protein